MACLSMPASPAAKSGEDPFPRQLGDRQRHVSIKARRSGAGKVYRIINLILYLTDPSQFPMLRK